MGVASATPPLREIELLRCRYASEYRALLLSLSALIGALALAIWFRKYEIAIALGGLWFSMVLTSSQAVVYNRLRGAEVTPKQFPDIYRMVEELRGRFKAPPIRVFVIRSSTPEAKAYGFRAPYVIVLHSSLVESLTAVELRCAVAQQLAKIVFGHTRIELLLGGDESTLPSVLSWLAGLRNLIFAWYRRAQVVSIDRAAVLANADVRAALRTLVKLSVGSDQFASVSEDEIIEQCRKAHRKLRRFQVFLILLQSTTPPLLLRLVKMVEWGGLPEKSLTRP